MRLTGRPWRFVGSCCGATTPNLFSLGAADDHVGYADPGVFDDANAIAIGVSDRCDAVLSMRYSENRHHLEINKIIPKGKEYRSGRRWLPGRFLLSTLLVVAQIRLIDVIGRVRRSGSAGR